MLDGDGRYAEDVESLNNQRNASTQNREEIALAMWYDYCNKRRRGN